LRRASHCLHGKRREQEGKHDSYYKSDKYGRIGYFQIELKVRRFDFDFVDVSGDERERGERRRTNGETLACRRGCIAK
jgi:hypothetical protein